MTDTLAAQMRAQAAKLRETPEWAITCSEAATALDAFADAAEALERQHFDATHWLSVRLNDLRVKLDAADRAAAEASAREAALAARLEEQAQHSMALAAEGAVLVAALEACRDYITGWDGCAPFDPPEPRSKRDREVRSVLEEARAALSAAPERARALAGIAAWSDEMCGWTDAGVRARAIVRAALGMEGGHD